MERECRLDVRFFAPPADLANCFTTFYRLEVDLPPGQVVEDQLQPEWANLRFFAEGSPISQAGNGEIVRDARFTATGPSQHPMRFSLGKLRMWGIGLLPLGWARFVGAEAWRHADTIVDGDKSEVFRQFAPLCRHLCVPDGNDEEQFAIITRFFQRHGKVPRDSERILAVHEAMIDPYLTQVTEFAEHTGLSKRTLERICLKHFGFPPRVLLRRQRLMRSLAAFMLSQGKSWSDQIDAHYHDQAHFVHEFHAFMGMRPGEYARLPHPILSAFMAERQRVWGSPVQTLDRPARG